MRSERGEALPLPSTPRVVRVLPDEPAVAKTFDYLLPEKLGPASVGARVRVPLGKRRVGGWVVATDVEPPTDVTLRPVAKLSGLGPSAELIELARWAAWRWAGRPASFLRTASPARVVSGLPAASGLSRAPDRLPGPVHALASRALAEAGPAGCAVLRLPPATDVLPAALVAAWQGHALVLCPTASMARAVLRGLRRAGVAAVGHPEGWAAGAAGATVVGTRAAAWAPVGALAAIVVLDEHDEGHAQEQAPTWHAREVARERARRAGVPCLLVSPCPSLEATFRAAVTAPAKGDERAGWPVVEVVDRRDDDPRTGLFSSRLVETLRTTRGRAVCVLNRVGRARLLACAACGELAACEACTSAVVQLDRGELACPRCEVTRPVLCIACGGLKLKVLRQGVSRAREELEALLGETVGESVGADGPERHAGEMPRVVVGTEAVLHQVARAEVVAFLDLDQELLATRYRAVEQAFGLVVRGARLAGGKQGGGRLLLQTRMPEHEVVQGALLADPARVAGAEADRRELLRFPPVVALAEVSGAAAPAYIEALGQPLGVEVLGPVDGRWLVRAADHDTLGDALAATPRPAGRLRVAVDPLRV